MAWVASAWMRPSPTARSSVRSAPRMATVALAPSARAINACVSVAMRAVATTSAAHLIVSASASHRRRLIPKVTPCTSASAPTASRKMRTATAPVPARAGSSVARRSTARSVAAGAGKSSAPCSTQARTTVGNAATCVRRIASARTGSASAPIPPPCDGECVHLNDRPRQLRGMRPPVCIEPRLPGRGVRLPMRGDDRAGRRLLLGHRLLGAWRGFLLLQWAGLRLLR